MVYGIIELINFAHGDVFMVGAFTSMFVLTNLLGQDGPADSPPLAVFLIVTVFLITMVVMGLLGVAIERFAYRPLRNAPRLAPLITAIGVSFILQNVVQILYGPSPDQHAAGDPANGPAGVRHVQRGRGQRVRDRGVGDADDRAPAVRQPHPARPRDALDGAGPRGRPADGR